MPKKNSKLNNSLRRERIRARFASLARVLSHPFRIAAGRQLTKNEMQWAQEHREVELQFPTSFPSHMQAAMNLFPNREGCFFYKKYESAPEGGFVVSHRMVVQQNSADEGQREYFKFHAKEWVNRAYYSPSGRLVRTIYSPYGEKEIMWNYSKPWQLQAKKVVQK